MSGWSRPQSRGRESGGERHGGRHVKGDPCPPLTVQALSWLYSDVQARTSSRYILPRMNTEFWLHFAASLGASTLVLGVGGFLAKTLIKHLLEKDREKAIEQIKSELAKMGMEHQIR